MNTIFQLPDIANSISKLKLILDLREKANPNTLTGIAIINAIDSKNASANEILSYVKDQAEDSPKTMANCIGDELTERILNFQL